MNNVKGILVLDALKGYLTRLLRETGHKQKVNVTYWAENTAGVLWTSYGITVKVPQVDESKTFRIHETRFPVPARNRACELYE